jgi:3,4-dihydroxy-2-butanone 4-phosphate synthase
MARLPEVTAFAELHGLPVLAVADLVRYRQEFRA